MPKFKISDRVRITRLHQFGSTTKFMDADEETQVDSAGDDLVGQTGVIRWMRPVGTRTQYFLETKSPSLHSGGLHDFFEEELELAE
jgi:hypothetical protein